MLATLQRCDDQHLDDEEKEAEDELNRELPGVHLRTENWQIAASDQDQVVFRWTLPEFGLEITKTYRLVKVPEAKLTESDYPAYHLQFNLTIKNIDKKTRTVAYRLDGQRPAARRLVVCQQSEPQLGWRRFATWSFWLSTARHSRSAVRPSPTENSRCPGKTRR